MSNIEWKKVDFREFTNRFGIDFILNNAPKILYSKKDKEHEDFSFLIAFFFLGGGLLTYISLSLYLMEIYFSLTVFIIVIFATLAAETFLILNYVKSKVFIIPLECWIEIYQYLDFYCFTYYVIFSGKCHPNKAKSIIFKLFQDELLKDTIDITQIEFYLKIKQNNTKEHEKIGFFFECGKGMPFIKEDINHNLWKFFSYETFNNDNYISVANWAHQYELKNDLESDIDKVHEYSPWIIKKWDYTAIKPLTDEFKGKINWNLRFIDSDPKLKPWEEELNNQSYNHKKPYWERDIIDDAIKNVIGKEYRVEKVKDLKIDLFKLKSYFRDLRF